MKQSPTLELAPDQVPDGWNRTSEAYDREIWRLMQPFVRDAIGHARIDGARVLDVAAGSGAVTIEVARRARTVLAIDFAGDMLARLRGRADRAGLDNIGTLVMDGQALTPLEDETFDAAISNFGLIFFPDRVRGISEMHRVLRPGGRAVISAWSTPERFDLFRHFGRAVQDALRDDPLPEKPKPIFSLADSQRLEAEMRAGGFADVAVHTVRHTLEVESASAYWEIMSRAAPPAVVLLERIGRKRAALVRDTLLAQLGRGPVTLVNEAHLGVGVRGS